MTPFIRTRTWTGLPSIYRHAMRDRGMVEVSLPQHARDGWMLAVRRPLGGLRSLGREEVWLLPIGSRGRARRIAGAEIAALGMTRALELAHARFVELPNENITAVIVADRSR